MQRRIWHKSSGVHICKSEKNDFKTWKLHYVNQEKMYLTYEHRIEIPVEFTYVNQKK
jgi:hypothetical protein